MTPLSVLRDARQLITPIANWTQGRLASNAHGGDCGVTSPEAKCFCAEGALIKVSGVYDKGPIPNSACDAYSNAAMFLNMAAGEMLETVNGRRHFIDINDGRRPVKGGLQPHPAILAAFDRAMVLASNAQHGIVEPAA